MLILQFKLYSCKFFYLKPFDKNVIIRIEPAIRVKAVVKFVISETNPIIDGPNNVPKYPIVATADTAMLNGILPLYLPAAEIVTGTIFASPAPANVKPRNDAQLYGR